MILIFNLSLIFILMALVVIPDTPKNYLDFVLEFGGRDFEEKKRKEELNGKIEEFRWKEF